MAQWLRICACVLASASMGLTLMAPRVAIGQAVNPIEFNCGYTQGVNKDGTGGPYYVVGHGNGPSHTFTGFHVDTSVLPNSCGSLFSVPGSLSTLAYGISADNFVVGRYQDSSGVWHGFVENAANGSYLGFNASDHFPGGGFTLPTGMSITDPTTHQAWIVGYYLINNTGASHDFAAAINTTAPMSIAKWISFDVVSSGFATGPSIDGSQVQVAGSYRDSKTSEHGFVTALADLQSLPSGVGAVTVVPSSSIARIDCAGSSGTAIHGISNVGTVVGSALGGGTEGYAFFAGPPAGGWVKNNSYTPTCTQIPIPGASGHGQTWASGISSDGVFIVGQGGSVGSFLYKP